MTPEQAKRAAFLIQARHDILYDLDPPQVDREDKKRWQYGLTPIGMDDADERFRIGMVEIEGGDGGGMHHEIATIDTELRSLGVEIEG